MNERQALIDAVVKFVNDQYGGDWKRAFDYYDDRGNKTLSRDDIVRFLADVGIGTRLTRWAYALHVIEAMDASGDGKISFEEFAKFVPIAQAACVASRMVPPLPETPNPDVDNVAGKNQQDVPDNTAYQGYTRGKADGLKRVEHNNPFPVGTAAHDEYNKAYREHCGW